MSEGAFIFEEATLEIDDDILEKLTTSSSSTLSKALMNSSLSFFRFFRNYFSSDFKLSIKNSGTFSRTSVCCDII